MYSINETQTNGRLELVLESPKAKSRAVVVRNEGASLQELIVHKVPVIKHEAPPTYQELYYSAILFPFANRIKDGQYTFLNRSYQLTINQLEEQNALHGLVYNKTFALVEQFCEAESATVKLHFHYEGSEAGFPFPFDIYLTYTLSNVGLELFLEVENKGPNAFPYTAGWHPYFHSEDLSKSSLHFESSEKIVFDQRMITRGIKQIETGTLTFDGSPLDDCFALNTNEVLFQTPNYQLTLAYKSPKAFLQVFTPPQGDRVAIEPVTGISNSFNNKIGLRVLKPNTCFSERWTLKITPKPFHYVG